MNDEYLLQALPFLPKIDADRREQFKQYFKSAPQWLLKSFTTECIDKGTTLVREGEPVDMVYLIGKGIVKATDYRIYGIPYDFTVFSEVYAYGGMEIIMEKDAYLTTLQAVTDCIVLKIPKAQYSKWLKTDFSAMKQEAKLVAEYLLEQGRNSRAFVFLQGSNRLAFLFINHYEKYAEHDVLCMNSNRQGLADYTGLSVKTITRSVQKFTEDGLITKKGKNIIIDREQYLRLKAIISEILVES